jgi:uracil-DNA glycosylase family 4
MNVPNSYFEARKRLMIVGQQTYGWENGNIDELLRCYKAFNFGENYHASPFWNITSKICNIMGISRFAIAWTNLVKCDFREERPPLHLEERIQEAFPVLREEVDILQPDLLIFFTGPAYDERIAKSFKNISFRALDEFSYNTLATVVGPDVPANTLRTYHPKYLRISGKEADFLTYIKHLHGEA